jgi:hypothetical protein
MQAVAHRAKRQPLNAFGGPATRWQLDECFDVEKRLTAPLTR